MAAQTGRHSPQPALLSQAQGHPPNHVVTLGDRQTLKLLYQEAPLLYRGGRNSVSAEHSPCCPQPGPSTGHNPNTAAVHPTTGPPGPDGSSLPTRLMPMLGLDQLSGSSSSCPSSPTSSPTSLGAALAFTPGAQRPPAQWNPISLTLPSYVQPLWGKARLVLTTKCWATSHPSPTS